MLVVAQLPKQRPAEPLNGAAVHLSRDQCRVQRAIDVLGDHLADHRDGTRLGDEPAANDLQLGSLPGAAWCWCPGELDFIADRDLCPQLGGVSQACERTRQRDIGGTRDSPTEGTTDSDAGIGCFAWRPRRRLGRSPRPGLIES